MSPKKLGFFHQNTHNISCKQKIFASFSSQHIVLNSRAHRSEVFIFSSHLKTDISISPTGHTPSSQPGSVPFSEFFGTKSKNKKRHVSSVIQAKEEGVIIVGEVDERGYN